jgi:hypothetical protein
MDGGNQRGGHIRGRPALDAWLEHGHTEAAAGSLSTRTAGSSASEAAVGAGSGSCCVANAEDTASTEPSAVGAATWERAAELDTVVCIDAEDVETNCMMASAYRLALVVEAFAAGNHGWLGSRGPSRPCSDDEEGGARGC